MTNEDLMNLGSESRKLIKKYLKEEDISINALSVRAKIHPTQLYLYLNGERGLTDGSLEKLGKVMFSTQG